MPRIVPSAVKSRALVFHIGRLQCKDRALHSTNYGGYYLKRIKSDSLAAEREFFSALVAQDRSMLERVLSDDFLLIDVMRGGLVTKPGLLSIIVSGQFRFESIEPFDSHMRLYGSTAVITGRTQMKMVFEATRFTLHSRYTHVFVKQGNEWRLVSAQGTQIAPDSGEAN